MFEGLKDMGKLLKQAKEMKDKMKKIQEELKKIEVSAQALDGKVDVVLNGEMEALRITIDPSVANDPAKLSKGLIKAFNDATKKAKDIAASKLSVVSDGLNLPGLG
ncbi:MAG: YbaB/EbfC family nucleoid-associated protein [Candidatus Margulisiibacteriota bacterium]